jgi:hypothetical protein
MLGSFENESEAGEALNASVESPSTELRLEEARGKRFWGLTLRGNAQAFLGKVLYKNLKRSKARAGLT